MCGETAHVHLVDDCARPGPFQGYVTFPVIRVRVRDYALHGRGGVISFQARGFTAVVLGDGNAASIRVQ